MAADDTTTEDAERGAEEMLAALQDLDVLYPGDAFAVLNEYRDRHLVDTLPLLPDDGSGEGEATLHRIPAQAHGERPRRTTWAVRIKYDHDGPEDYHVLTSATEEEARNEYADLVEWRLDEGRGAVLPTPRPRPACADPNNDSDG